MQNLISFLDASEAFVGDLCGHAEGLDPVLLLEAMYLTDADFSEPVDGATLLRQLKEEGLT